MRRIVAASGQAATPAISTRVEAALKTRVRRPAAGAGIRNTGEQAMLVMPEHARGVYIGFVGPA